RDWSSGRVLFRSVRPAACRRRTGADACRRYPHFLWASLWIKSRKRRRTELARIRPIFRKLSDRSSIRLIYKESVGGFRSGLGRCVIFVERLARKRTRQPQRWI